MTKTDYMPGGSRNGVWLSFLNKKILTLFIETAARGEKGDHHTG